MFRWIALALFLATLALACGETPTADPPAEEPVPEGLEGTEDVADALETGAAESDCTYDEVYAAVEGLEGQERRDTLVSMAEGGSDLSLYTSLNAAIADEVLSAYEEDTGLSVALYRASDQVLRNRLIEEAAAGFAGADVVETNGPTLVALANEGVLAPLNSPATDGLVEGAVRELWTASRFNIYTPAWNTELVTDPPQTYLDLADPKWDGRMAMEIEDYDWYWSLWNYLVEDKGMTPEEVDAYFNELAEGADFTSGHTATRQLVVAGEYALFVSDYSYGVAEAAAAGAPIDWQPAVEPLFGRPNGIALVCNAPNPAAALVFTEWYLNEGQEVLVANNVDPARETLLDLDGAEVRIINMEEYLAELDEFIAMYEELAGVGNVVG